MLAQAYKRQSVLTWQCDLDSEAVFMGNGQARHIARLVDGQPRPVTLCCISSAHLILEDGRSAACGSLCPRCLGRAVAQSLAVAGPITPGGGNGAGGI
jgi:hypothetical protein